MLLAKALNALAADRAHTADRYLLLQVENQHLCLQWDVQNLEEHTALCLLPIVNTIQECGSVLVPLRSLRAMLRQFKEPVVCLEQGDIRLRNDSNLAEDAVLMSFVRLSQPVGSSLKIMTASAKGLPSPSTAGSSVEHPPTSSETEEKGAMLARV